MRYFLNGLFWFTLWKPLQLNGENERFLETQFYVLPTMFDLRFSLFLTRIINIHRSRIGFRAKNIHGLRFGKVRFCGKVQGWGKLSSVTKLQDISRRTVELPSHFCQVKFFWKKNIQGLRKHYSQIWWVDVSLQKKNRWHKIKIFLLEVLKRF